MRHAEVVSMLIQYGADPNIKGKEGTALDLATKDDDGEDVLAALTGCK
jgi:hypothetical protein